MKTVCFDLDGVLAEYHGWRKDGGIGPLLPAGVRLLKLCKDAGYKTVLSTCRTHPRHGEKALTAQIRIITDWLNKHELLTFFDRIDTEGKPLADVYIDDRALRFEQAWGRLEAYGDWLFAYLKRRLKEAEP